MESVSEMIQQPLEQVQQRTAEFYLEKISQLEKSLTDLDSFLEAYLATPVTPAQHN